MKAMMSGCIPISSRYENSVLKHLTAGFDLGASYLIRDLYPIRPPYDFIRPPSV
jgi:hypothetical protein